MTLSTTFRSRILRTKKRLSEGGWGFGTFCIAVLGLLGVLTYGLRSVAVKGVYGEVRAEIPVVPASVEDPAWHRFKESAAEDLKKSTATVVLTAEAFYFGDMDAFTKGYGEVRNKFVIPHVDGEPQLMNLLKTLDTWTMDRARVSGVKTQKILVFVPTGDIPMSIVIQVMSGLSGSPLFDRVILGSGLI